MTVVLFVLTALLWGGGALATSLQAGVTAAPWSVAIRMGLASLLFLGWARARGGSLRLPVRHLPAVALQGVLFFAVAVVAFYEATRRIPSGLAALVLSLSSIAAGVIGRVFLGTPLSGRLLAGALCGLVGIAIIFGPRIGALGDSAAAGLAFALLAVVGTSGGTVVGARNQRAGLPTQVVLGWASVVGGAACAAWSLATGIAFVPDLSLRWIGSLLYLAVAASLIAFALYFELVRRLDPGRAAYVLASVPVVALVLSSLFEGLALDGRILLGALAVLAGNVLVLRH